MLMVCVGGEGEGDSDAALRGWDQHSVAGSLRDAAPRCDRGLLHLPPPHHLHHTQQTLRLHNRPL